MSSVPPLRLEIVKVTKDDCIGLCLTFYPKCRCGITCKWCLRSFGQEDPLRKGYCLQRPGDRGLLCEHCRNTNAWKFKTEGTDTRTARLTAMERHIAERVIFQNFVQDWLESKMAGDGG